MSRRISTQVKDIEAQILELQVQKEQLQTRCKHKQTQEYINEVGHGCWGEREFERYTKCLNCLKILSRG